MSGARDEQLQLNIFSRTNSVTLENFGQAESHAKILIESKRDAETDRISRIYLVMRESKFIGMITVDYGYFLPTGIFKTESRRFALLDTFELAPDPKPSDIRWREVSRKNVEAAKARLLKVGHFVTSAQLRSLFPAILAVLRKYNLPTSDPQVLKPGEGEELHGLAAARYGSAYYNRAVPDQKAHDVKPSPASAGLADSLASLTLSAGPTLFSSSALLPSAAPVVPVAAPAPAEVDVVAENFSCPISSAIMRNPVLALDGHNYEDSCIRGWITQQGQRARSPMDNKTEIRDVFPNIELRNRIHESVLASPALAKEFWSVHKDAILHPRLELGEIDFSAKFKKKYAGLMSEAAPEGSRRAGPGSS